MQRGARHCVGSPSEDRVDCGIVLTVARKRHGIGTHAARELKALSWFPVIADIDRILPPVQRRIRAAEILSQLISLGNSPCQRVEIRERPDTVSARHAAAHDPETFCLRANHHVAGIAE